ncbi:MAG TPA: hypothetical protein VJU84_15560 [Pyrinomonadaceae bacterium]|nr:hypothetical protein [Pyrinomonadaceae bacterium]
MFIAALCLICFSLSQGASQLTNTKRITAVQVGESAEGSRVIVTGDSLLDDYEAFRRGERFYLRIPSADFVAASPRFQGNGFEDVQVQKVGDSVVISFRLHPGANARVMGAANRLEIIFTAPSYVASNDSAKAVRNRVARNSGAEKPPATRSSSKAGSDAAGPMPPDSPNTNTDYSVQPPTSTTASRSQTSTDPVKTNALARKGANPAGTLESTTTPATTATPYPTTSPYSTAYPPATSTYSPAPSQPVAQTTDTFFGLESRGRALLQWGRTNKTVSAGVGLGLMSLLGVVLFLLYRRRRNRRVAMAKGSRVQPKYSPDVELEDMLATRLATESTTVSPERYGEQDSFDSWSETNETDEVFFEDLPASSRGGMSYSETPAPYNVQNEDSWEYVPESNPQAYKSRVQEEREVFEL